MTLRIAGVAALLIAATTTLHCSGTIFVSSFSIAPQQPRSLHRTVRTSMSAVATTNEDDDCPKIVVVGSANYDMTVYTGILPVLGETVTGTKFETGCGGKGANQATAAGSIAASHLICRVGDDVFGTELLKNLADRNVQVSASVRVDNASTGVASIVVDTNTGDNMIIVTPGANYELTADDVVSELQALSHVNWKCDRR